MPFIRRLFRGHGDVEGQPAVSICRSSLLLRQRIHISKHRGLRLGCLQRLSHSPLPLYSELWHPFFWKRVVDICSFTIVNLLQ